MESGITDVGRCLFYVQIDLHGGAILFAICMFVYDGLTHGIGLATSEASGVLAYVATVLVGVELCEYAGIAVIAANIA